MSGRQNEATLPKPLSNFIALLKRDGTASNLAALKSQLTSFYGSSATADELAQAITQLSQALAHRSNANKQNLEAATDLLAKLKLSQLDKQRALCIQALKPTGATDIFNSNAETLVQLFKTLLRSDGSFEAKQRLNDTLLALTELLRKDIVVSTEILSTPPTPTTSSSIWSDLFSSEPDRPQAPKPTLSPALLEAGFILLAKLRGLKQTQELASLQFTFCNHLRSGVIKQCSQMLIGHDPLFSIKLADFLNQFETNLTRIITQAQAKLAHTLFTLAIQLGEQLQALDTIADATYHEAVKIAVRKVITELVAALIPELTPDLNTLETALQATFNNVVQLQQREQLTKKKISDTAKLFTESGPYNARLFAPILASTPHHPLYKILRTIENILNSAASELKNCTSSEETLFTLTESEFQPTLIPASALLLLQCIRQQLFQAIKISSSVSCQSLGWQPLLLGIAIHTFSFPPPSEQLENKPWQWVANGAIERAQCTVLIGAESDSIEHNLPIFDLLSSPRFTYSSFYELLCLQPKKPLAAMRVTPGFGNSIYGYLNPAFALVVHGSTVRAYKPSTLGEFSATTTPTDIIYVVPLDWVESLRKKLKHNVDNALAVCAAERIRLLQGPKNPNPKNNASAKKASDTKLTTDSKPNPTLDLAKKIQKNPSHFSLELSQLWLPTESLEDAPQELDATHTRSAPELSRDKQTALIYLTQHLTESPPVTPLPSLPSTPRAAPSWMWILYLGLALGLGLIGMAASFALHFYGLSPLAFLLDQLNIAQAKMFIGMSALPIAANLAFGFSVAALVGGFIDLVIFTFHSLFIATDDSSSPLLAQPAVDLKPMAATSLGPAPDNAEPDLEASYSFRSWLCCRSSTSNEMKTAPPPGQVPTPSH